MPIELFNSLIAVGFVSVWILIGQFTFIRS